VREGTTCHHHLHGSHLLHLGILFQVVESIQLSSWYDLWLVQSVDIEFGVGVAEAFCHDYFSLVD
jgi:hypothetical protein